MRSTRWMLAPGVVAVTDRDGVVLFAARSSSYWRGNPSAAVFCEEARSGASVRHVTRLLAEEFGVEENQLVGDVEALALDLSKASLIVEVPG